MLKYIIILIVIVIITSIFIYVFNTKNGDINIYKDDTQITNIFFKICNEDNQTLTINDNILQFNDINDDKLMIGKSNTLILFHNNLVYELGINLQGQLISTRVPELQFSILNNRLLCNNYLFLNNNLKFVPNNTNLVSIQYI